jgi:glycosyltransferase involved in cell wall biosynthesis
MPVYNASEFLKETMDSVLNQTFNDFYFLIINDGSNDNSEEIIKSYEDERIVYIKNTQNLGLVATLNKGIDLVNTEFLARMDADDLWVVTKLEKQLEVLDFRPEVGICGTSIRKFGDFEGDFFFPVNNAGLKVGFIFFCCMSHPSVVFRMSFLRESGLRYLSDYFPAEDYKLWVECLKHTQIFNIAEKLVFYRQHKNQITQESNSEQTRITNKVRLEVIEELSDNFSEEEKTFHLNRFLKSNIQSNKDYFLFLDWIEKLLRLNRMNNSLFDESILKTQLIRHVQVAYWEYIRQKYFRRKTIGSIFKYAFSFEWIYLSPKYNLKLVFKK